MAEEDGLISNDVTSGLVISDEFIYVGTSYGLSVIDNGTIENYVIPNKHFGNNCISVVPDNSNRTWIGTWETGLNLYDSGYWIQIMGKEQEMLGTVRSTVFGPDGLIVFNTTNGVVMKDNDGWRVYNRQNGVSSDDIRCGVFDAQGSYWAGTSAGLSCLTKGVWKRYRAIHGLPSDDIWSCAIDSNGTLWFGTTEGVISIADNAVTDRTPEISMEKPDVRSITTAGNTIYFGTVYGNKFLNTQKGIYSITAEPSGTLWFGTNGDGVIRLENNKSCKYTMADGLPSDYVRSVAFYDDVLWVACYGGIGTIEMVDE